MGEIEDLKAQNTTLKAAQQLLQNNVEKLKNELEKMKTESKSSDGIGNDDEKETEKNLQKKDKKKKYNLNKIEHQIEILNSESLMTKSLFLLVKPEYVNKSDNGTRNFSFLQFLKESLDDKVVN